MVEKRINLCFNIADKRQEVVYDFLMEKGKRKTATVIDLVMAYLSGDSGRRVQAVPEVNNGELAEQLGRVVKENLNRGETEKIQQSLDKILALLESGVTANSKTGERESDSDSEMSGLAESEMSDDAFSAMMSIFGI